MAAGYAAGLALARLQPLTLGIKLLDPAQVPWIALRNSSIFLFLLALYRSGVTWPFPLWLFLNASVAAQFAASAPRAHLGLFTALLAAAEMTVPIALLPSRLEAWEAAALGLAAYAALAVVEVAGYGALVKG